jgi:hypothetical protein
MKSLSEARKRDSGWNDLGVVFHVRGQRPWMTSHGYVPTAYVRPDRIRVFAAFWDQDRIGRVGYVDLDRDDPTRVIGHSEAPVLGVGAPGTFDEHGTTPMSIVADGDTLRLYYAGWQRSASVRYFLFTGLAISHDGGETFVRVSDVPVLDRIAGHHLVRTGFIARHGGVWKAWIAQSDGLIDVAGKPTPSYSLDYLESDDGVVWPAASTRCLDQGREGIFGYGRSAIWSDGEIYHAMLSVRRHDGYRIEYSDSPDGIRWRAPEPDGFSLSPRQTRDHQTETMFPSVARVDDNHYVFYNGDDFGRDGVRCARWVNRS